MTIYTIIEIYNGLVNDVWTFDNEILAADHFVKVSGHDYQAYIDNDIADGEDTEYRYFMTTLNSTLSVT